jgi:hypothetical protein
MLKVNVIAVKKIDLVRKRIGSVGLDRCISRF